MRSNLRPLLMIGLLWLLASPGQAAIGVIDKVPAATLLLPYFEVDIARSDGVNTLFSINNAAATAVLAHVTVWTDQAVPALAFDVYLTGYDVQTVSLRDIFVDGKLPLTASDGQDPTDTISPQGEASQDVNFASCGGMPYVSPAVDAAFRAHLQAWLQGRQSPATGTCAGSKTQDGILRGYVTVDTVNACSLYFPSDWSLYGPLMTDQNVLWGDVLYVNPRLNSAQGETLAHIQSCPSCFATGDHTFYGRYNGATADDSREPLPTTMAARFLNGGGFDGGTDYVVWRETGSAAVDYSCRLNGPPSWYPLAAEQIVIFDEEEQPVTNEACPGFCDPGPSIPHATQRFEVAGDLLSPFDFGWTYMNLQHPGVFSPYRDDDAQAWVTVLMAAEGRYSVGFDAIQLDNASNPAAIPIPIR